MLKNKVAIPAVVVGVFLTIAMVLVGISFTGSIAEKEQLPIFLVKRGPLNINVVESGTIKAREQIIIKNEVEGKTSIIYLIPEGSQVLKDDLLVELDASSLMDARLDQEIRVQNAEAYDINATEQLAVAENQAKSDIDLAKLTLEFARQDLKKYTEGEYPNELKKADAEITLAEEELTRVSDTLKWSQTLENEKYISQTELLADQLSEKKKSLDLELAQNNRDLLVNYTYKRNLAKRMSDVGQAQMALERTRRKARADVVQAKAALKARQLEFKRHKDKLEKFEEQIKKTKIHAPADGLVMYATSAQPGKSKTNGEPLQEGQDIRERQEMIYLSTVNLSNAEIDLHESNLKKVSVNMPVVVTVDSLPGKKFSGRIAHIAKVPDAQSLWMNPSQKVYTTKVFLDKNDVIIRAGMGCKAEIVIESYLDTLFVPVKAVFRVAGVPTVYVHNGYEFEPRSVETGLDNSEMIHVLKGLHPGDTVLLTKPANVAGVESKVPGNDFRNGRQKTGDSESRTSVPEKRVIPLKQAKIEQPKKL